MRNDHLALLGLTLCTLVLAHAEPALAQVAFDKAETVATGLLASFRGTLATAFFGIAFVITGFLAAFNRCQRQSKSEPKGSAKCCHFGVGEIAG